MKRIIRQALCFLNIIILLPYVLTVFINGKDVAVTMKDVEKEIYVDRQGHKEKVPLKEYGTGLLAVEIDADMEEEALKAQAVLIRTEIYRKIKEEGSDVVFQKKYLSVPEMKKAWGMSYKRRYRKIKQAWETTEDQIIEFNGEPALTPYHYMSNGHTRNAAEAFGKEGYPYLVMKDCPDDLTAADFQKHFLLPEMEAEITKKDSAGYALEVRCGKEIIPAEKFKETYHIPSMSFEIEKSEEGLGIKSFGRGHGIGMSQYTADSMAGRKKDYKEIIQYFFEGTSIEVVAQIITKKQ